MTASVPCLECRRYTRLPLPAPEGAACVHCDRPLDAGRLAKLNAMATDPKVRAALEDLAAVAAAEEEADRARP